ncbi:hypothetical protein JZO82_01450 [Vagococcus fluvialis]|uniref:hypothetical protein n=1 Tax=Vagococcus fluvialis TaxID=2738 RepID=UPI001A906837|nr:hypothetical protein [Vagococcus fluvialis]MBO0427815.1 hypothetical protein [Vagococcus fluvialis]
MKNKKDEKKKGQKFIVKNYDADGKYIEDLSKVVLPLELSQTIANIIWGDIKNKKGLPSKLTGCPDNIMRYTQAHKKILT